MRHFTSDPLAFVAALAFLLGAAAAQADGDKPAATQPTEADKPANRPGADPREHDFAEMNRRMMEAMTPDEEHRDLARFIGHWNVKIKAFMMGPEPMESAATAEFRWLIPGLWVAQEMKGTIMGMPYHGFGISGYDNFQKKYVGSWVNNMSTELLTMSGNHVEDPKVRVEFGTLNETMTGENDKMVRYVSRIKSDDEFVLEIHDTAISEDPKKTLVMEFTYTRTAAPATEGGEKK